jgi:type I restriction enzyme S subunit
MKYGLTETTVENICAVFARFPEIEKAILYGSRAKGNFKTGSDIDLTLYGEALTSDLCSTIASELDDLLLPYTIDLSVFNELNHAKLREHIERVGMLFYEQANHGGVMKKGWQIKILADTCAVFADGDWVESKDQSPEGIRLIQTGNVGEGVFKDRGEKARYISEATFKRLRCTEIFKGDCLISRLPDPVGRSCILPYTGERMITAVDCTIVRFNPKQLIPGFFNYFSQSLDYLKAVEVETTGTTRKRISRSKLAQVAIPVPPLPEQKRIVGILDEAFDGIATAKANAEKNLQNARALFESHLQAVFTQRGEGWVERTIGDTCVLKSGTTVSAVFEKSEGDIPYLKVADMTHEENMNQIVTSSRFLNEEDVGKNAVLPPGTTIFPKRGGAILTNKKRLTSVPICADLNIMGVIPNKSLLPQYLYFYFLNVDMRQLGSGSSIPQINNYDIAPLVITYPESKKTQTEITDQLTSLSAETQRLESIYQQKLAALEALKKSLLHQAFSGQL